ncbi:MAG: hypothetical protein ACREH3_08545, partial [Geminicoccales bacterium]
MIMSRREALPRPRARQAWRGLLVLAFTWTMATCAMAVAASAAEGVPGVAASAAESTAEPAALPQPLSPQTIRDLVARLNDDQVRALLIAQLDKAAAADQTPTAQPSDGLVRDFEAGVGKVRALWERRIAALPDLPGVVPFLLGRLADGKTAAQMLLAAVLVAIIFGVGVVAERVFARLTATARASIPDHQVERFTTRLGYLLQRFVWQVLNLVVFGVAIVAIFFAVYQGHAPTRLTVMTYLLAIVLVRLVAAGSRFLLAPWAPSLRLISFRDEDAQRLHRWIVAVAAIGAFGFLSGDLLQLLGLDLATLEVYQLMVGILFVAAMIGLIWQARRPVAELIRGQVTGATPLADRLRLFLAQSWHWLATAYELGILATYQIRTAHGQETAVSVGILSLL